MASRFVLAGSPGDFLWHLQILAGLILVLAGILIAVFPWLLQALISAIIMLCGVTLIGTGWRTRALMRYRRHNEFEVIDP